MKSERRCSKEEERKRKQSKEGNKDEGNVKKLFRKQKKREQRIKSKIGSDNSLVGQRSNMTRGKERNVKN